jgi:hypothetical protein
MSYKAPAATASSPGIIVPGTNLSVTAGVLNVVPVALFDQAYFYSTVTQTNPIASTTNIISFNNGPIGLGITLQLGTQLTVSRTANYNLQFTAQVDKTDGGDDLIDFWIVRNGTNYPDSNSQSVVIGAVGVLVASWNFSLTLTAGDYVEIAWSSADTAMRLLTVPAQVGPVRPVTPSVRCTIIQL